MYSSFTADTGIKVNIISGKGKALMERLNSEGANSPADVFITVDAGNLWKVQKDGMFQAISSSVVDSVVPANLRGPNNEWVAIAKRSRVMYYNPLTVSAEIPKDKKDFNLKNFNNCDLELLTNNHEIDLIRKMLDWDSIIETSVILYEPHRIAYYLYELSAVFHSLWNQGKVDPNLRFIEIENDKLSYARVALILSVQKTIKSGLDILGVSAPEEMH